MDYFLQLHRIKVENANAISGFTWGFPAISNFLGFSHALSRKVESVFGFTLGECAVICHKHHTQAYRQGGYRYRFALTRNPLGKDGSTASLVEEGRMNMEVSLLLKIKIIRHLNTSEEALAHLRETITNWVYGMRLSGGIISEMKGVSLINWPDESSKQLRAIVRKLLPGYVIVSANSLLADENNKQLDKWLDYSALRYEGCLENNKYEGDVEKNKWRQIPRTYSGWIRPAVVGFQSISELIAPGQMENARDNSVPARFVEPIHGLVEWFGIHRVTDIEKFGQIFWRYEYKNEDGQYLCANDWQRPSDAEFIETYSD